MALQAAAPSAGERTLRKFVHIPFLRESPLSEGPSSSLV